MFEFTPGRISRTRPYWNVVRRRILHAMRFRTLVRLVGSLLLAACAAPAPPVAKRAPATGAERVLVVINTRSAASDSVGRYYAKRRGIDPSHICLLYTSRCV